MKLNAEIVYRELSKRYRAEFFPNGDDALTLSGPEFYMDDEQNFPEGRLYLATVEHLPPRPRIQRDVCLVCIGDGFNLGYYKERLSLILIRSKADFFKVFRALQEIFAKYDAWESALYEDLIRGTDIGAMIRDSEEVFPSPLYVMDRSFRLIAVSRNADTAGVLRADSDTLDPGSFSKYLEAEKMMTERRNAFVVDTYDRPVLCVNLFGRSGEYAGCLWLDIGRNGPEPGTARLAEYLAGMIETAIERNPQFQTDLQASAKGLMQTLIEEQPLSKSQRVLLKSINNAQPYVCIYFRSAERHQKMPMNYISSVFEETYRDSAAFLYDDGIAALLNVSALSGEETAKTLGSFCTQMRLAAGVSEPFTDLFNIRTQFLQAQSALEDGKLFREDGSLFFFRDYALVEMIINSLGGLPAEAYFPEGLRALIDHDKDAQVSYLETLKVLLEENLSYTAAAKRLYIHRSTLIDRAARIEREMGLDLTDPDQRLLLSMLLKAMDLEDVMRQR